MGFDALAQTDPPSAWSLAESMATARQGHSMTLLVDSRVLVAGGEKRDDSRIFLSGAETYTSAVVYVDSGAEGANDGSSWADAYTDLQDALGGAESGDEIWVAAGTYKPTDEADRAISFVLKNGVGLFGGFAGGETARDQRDWEANTTTLSGDIGVADDDSDNSYHVVKCGSVALPAVLDGFAITGGNADGAEPDDRGGGMHTVADGNLEVANCIFDGNRAYVAGGGMYNAGGPALSRCIFIGNIAGTFGGGLYNGGSPTVTDCVFIGNDASGFGDGIFNDRPAFLTLRNTILVDNGGEDLYNAATVVSSGNIVEFFTGFSPDETDITGEQLGLDISAIYRNGGPASIRSLLPESAAIEATAASETTATDRRAAPTDSSPDTGAPEINIVYVDSGASGANDGSSWTDAFTDLQDALEAAVGGDEIWVAAGTYKPTDGADRTISFILADGVGLYGGFAGGENAREQRDWETHVTTLSGDIGLEGDSGDNSCHVVICEAVSDATVIDGFTISGVRASRPFHDDEGGGFLIEGSPTVSHCTFSGNSAYHNGGGMYNKNGNPTVTNCTFSGNSASYGGGMSNSYANVTVINCNFSANSAYRGGGMSNERGNVTVIKCNFSGNSAFRYGGGMHNEYLDSPPAVTNCNFSGNHAAKGGGGMYNSYAHAIVTNCTFSGNSASYGGGDAQL